MERLNKSKRYQESVQRGKLVSGRPFRYSCVQGSFSPLWYPRQPQSTKWTEPPASFLISEAELWESVPLPREKRYETGLGMPVSSGGDLSILFGGYVEGPSVCPNLLIEEYPADKICLIFPWDHSMIWDYGQVAPSSFSHRLPGTIEAQQLKVFLFQLFSPGFRVLSWGEERPVSHSWQLWSQCPPWGDVTNYQCLGELQRHRKMK